MVGLVHRGVPAALVGLEPVLLEAGSRVHGRRLEYDIDAPPQITNDRAAVALEARDALDHAVSIEDPACGPIAQQLRQVVDATWWKFETVRRHCQIAGVGDRCHLDR